jgi:hypothetical protein
MIRRQAFTRVMNFRARACGFSLHGDALMRHRGCVSVSTRARGFGPMPRSGMPEPGEFRGRGNAEMVQCEAAPPLRCDGGRGIVSHEKRRRPPRGAVHGASSRGRFSINHSIDSTRRFNSCRPSTVKAPGAKSEKVCWLPRAAPWTLRRFLHERHRADSWRPTLAGP